MFYVSYMLSLIFDIDSWEFWSTSISLIIISCLVYIEGSKDTVIIYSKLIDAVMEEYNKLKETLVDINNE